MKTMFRFGSGKGLVFGVVSLVALVCGAGCTLTAAPFEESQKEPAVADPGARPEVEKPTPTVALEDKFASQGKVLVQAAPRTIARDLVRVGSEQIVLRRARTSDVGGDEASEIVAVKADGSRSPTLLVRSEQTINHISAGSGRNGAPVIYATRYGVFAVRMGGGEPVALSPVECQALTNDTSHVYCVTASSPIRILRIPLEAAVEPVTLATLDNAVVPALAFDPTTHRLFYADSVTSSIYAMSIEGGQRKLLASKIPNVASVTMDGDNLYVSSENDGVSTLYQIDKLEGQPLALFTSARPIRSLALHAEHVYFTDPGTDTSKGFLSYSGSVSKVAIHTTSVANQRQYVVMGLHEPYGLTVDAAGVYVSSLDDGSVKQYVNAVPVANGNCRAEFLCRPCDQNCMLAHATQCIDQLGCGFEIVVSSWDSPNCNVRCVDRGGASGSTTL